jgi:hypothetical protein
MPSVPLSAAFFVGLLEKKRRLLNDEDLQLLYDFGSHPIDGKVKYLSESESKSLQSLAAAVEPDHTILLDSKPKKGRLKDDAYSSGSAALAKWFKKAKISSKIHSSVETVLEESNAHPRQLLEDEEEEISPMALPDEETIHSDIELGVAIAVFGCNVASPRLTSVQVKLVKIIMHHVWNRLRKERQRMYKSMSAKKRAWLKAKKSKLAILDYQRGLNHSSGGIESGATDLAAEEVPRLMKSVKEYAASVAWHPKERDGAEGVEEAISVVQGLMQGLGKQPKTKRTNASE